MQVNFDQGLLGLDDKPLEDGEGPITLGRVAVEVLCGMEQGEKVTGEQKLARFKLAQRIRRGDPVQVSVEEVALLKERLAKFCPPVVMGRCWEILDPTGE